MKYKKDGKTIEASPKAFRVIYAAQGYVPVADQAAVPAPGAGMQGEDMKPEGADVPSETAKNLEDMTVAELKTMAKGKGLEGVSALNKGELLEVLKGAV